MPYKLASLLLSAEQKSNSIAKISWAEADHGDEANELRFTRVGKIFSLVEINATNAKAKLLLDFFSERPKLNYYGQLEIDKNEYPSPEDLEKLLSLASFGQLLPNMQFDWVDSFKADYSDSMIDLLSRLRDSKQFVGNDNLRIQISNCILRFDSLDEESVRVKCRALVDLKRMGMAYTAFDQFTKEYKLILNEDFKYSFEQFISEV